MTKIFLDTNILVAASIRQHPHFDRADRLLLECKEKEAFGIVHAHSLLEFHSAVTQLPKGLAVPPAQVQPLLEEGILAFVKVISLSEASYHEVLKRAGRYGVIGGMVYDLFHLVAAEQEQVDTLYTFNVSHFRRLATPAFADRIMAP